MPTIEFTTVMTTVHCAGCGMLFAVTDAFERRRREDHGTFYCPMGHQNFYAQKTAVEQLREQLAQKEREAAQLKASNQRLHQHWDEEHEARQKAERSVRGHKAVVTRMKRRLVAGRCPCCSRQFKDLAAHMEGQHPGWDPDRAAAAIAAKEQA